MIEATEKADCPQCGKPMQLIAEETHSGDEINYFACHSCGEYHD